MIDNARDLSERLQASLDEMDAPTPVHERIHIVSKLLDVPKHIAHSLLQGHYFPEQDLLEKIYTEFELEHESH